MAADSSRVPPYRFREVATELLLGESLDAKTGRRIGRSFVDAVNAAVAVVRRPVPPGRYWRGMRGRAFLERYFASQIEERMIAFEAPRALVGTLAIAAQS
jgi:hypothetical protein